MPALLTLAQAKQQVNAVRDTDDAELADFIAATVDLIEGVVGPVEPRTVTESVRGGAVLLLSTLPVLEVTAIATFVGGAPVGLAGITLDGQAGIVRGAGTPGGLLTVTYVAGREHVPPAINLAARIVLQHMWDTQRRNAIRPVMQQGEAPPPPGVGAALPARAEQLLAPYRLAPAIA